MAQKLPIDIESDPNFASPEAGDNMALWKSVQSTNPAAVKPITGRQYQGTSPNPTYLAAMATARLGPCGKGWGFEVVTEDWKDFPDGTVLHWCRIRFWIESPSQYFDSYGQTKAAYQRAKDQTWVIDEDAPKKSLTDAMTKAMSQLGFAADIFLGRWDDQKYVAGLREEYGTPDEPMKPEGPARSGGGKPAPF